jgi:hypothetical protein
MQIFEKIQLEGEPFPKPLPMPPDELIGLLRKHGFEFCYEDSVLRWRGNYEPTTLNKVKTILAANKIVVHAWRTVWEKYGDDDFRMAPLWLLTGVPEIWVSGIDFCVQCAACGRKRFHVDPSVRVQSVATRKPLVSVNGQFEVVRSDVANRIERELQGADLPRFDEEGKYHYFLSKRSLRHLIVKPEQAIGLNGTCDKCTVPIFEMFFGPLRYASGEWKGEDIIHCNFLSCNAYTPKAYELIRSVEKKVTKDGIILLEEQ